MKQYGKIISRLRKENNMTQAELGMRLNVTYQAVSKWENDQSQPDFATMVQIAELFHVPLTVFLEDSSEQSVNSNEPVIGYCTSCGNAVTQKNLAQKRPQLMCKECAAAAQKRKELEEADKKAAAAKQAEEERIQALKHKQSCARARNKGLIWAGVLTSMLLIFMIVVAASAKNNAGTIILGTVIICVFLFTFIAQMFWNGFVYDACLFGGKIIGTPGIIFSFSLDGFIFLIGMKILFALIRLLFFLFTMLLSACFAFLCSPFTFVPSLLRVNKQGVSESI